MSAGAATTEGSSNAFFGKSAGVSNITGNNNTVAGYNADVKSGNLIYATAIGAGSAVIASNQIQLGREGYDSVRVGKLAVATQTLLCINSGNILAACSSSMRYKENVQPLRSGLKLVRRLRPVAFDWKDRQEPDLGLIAEEVAEVEPLLVTYNDQGEIQGVKYAQLSVVLINAIKEQQKLIELQRLEIERHRAMLDRQGVEIAKLKRLVSKEQK